MDFITESFPDYRTSNYFHKQCFNLEKEVKELHEIAIPFHLVTYEARNYEEFVSDNDGKTVNCFRCNDTIILC